MHCCREKVSTVPVTPLEEDNRKLVPGVSWILLCVHFPFADFSLYLFIIINCNYIMAFLSSVDASIKSWKVRVVLGTLKLQELLDNTAECVTAIAKSPPQMSYNGAQHCKFRQI